jgi:predicted DNA-binding transcriptional regulator AlpA
MMSATTVDRMVYRPELRAALRVSSESMRRWMHDGKLPKPDVYLSAKVMGWRLSTLVRNGIGIL